MGSKGKPSRGVSWDLRENGSLFYRDTGETSSGNRGAAWGGFLKGFTKIVVVGATVISRFSMEMK